MNSSIRSFIYLIKIIFLSLGIRDKLYILFLSIYSIFCSIFQYIYIGITAKTFSLLTTGERVNEITTSQNIYFGLTNLIVEQPINKIIIIWGLSSLLSSISIILNTFLTTNLAFKIGHEINKKTLKIFQSTNSDFHERYPDKTIFNLLTSENLTLIRRSLFSLLSIPLYFSSLVSFISIIIIIGKSFSIIFSLILFTYFILNNLFLKNVKNRSSLTFDLKSDLSDLLGIISNDYLDIIFKPFKKNYHNTFSKKLSKLKDNEVMIAFIPRIQKVILELIIIIMLGFFLIYSIFIKNISIESFIGESTAITFSVFKLIPVISNISQLILAFSAQYKLITTYKNIFSEYKKYLLNNNNKQATLIQNKENKLIINNVYSPRIAFCRGSSTISITHKIGSILWITGSSGCGKSTLFSMISGIRPIPSGSIKLFLEKKKFEDYIDSNNIYEAVSFSSQKTVFYSVSVKEFINEGNKDISDKEIINLLEGFNLPKTFGLNSKETMNLTIGSKGYSPSGGQSKLLTLIRALCRKNKQLYLFDEPTSELSKKLRNKVLSHIYALSEKKFVICITHDLSVIRSNDQVLEL